MINLESTSEGITLDYDGSTVWSITVKGRSLALSLEDHKVVLSLLPFLALGRKKQLRKLKILMLAILSQN